MVMGRKDNEEMKLADYDFSRHAGIVTTVYVVFSENGNEAYLYLKDETHFMTVERKVAQSVVNVIHSHNIETKADLFKMDQQFCLTLHSLAITFYTMSTSKR